MRSDTVRMLTLQSALDELHNLIQRSGMSLDELKANGEAWNLDAEQRGILSEIRGLEFLIDRARAVSNTGGKGGA